MSNSVFNVTEPDASDSITLVMSPGGTISPDKETVKEYLSTRSKVDINLVTMKELESDNVTVMLDTLTYVNSEDIEDSEELNDIAKNLLSFKMDHDYTPLTSPTQTPEPPDASLEDSLAQTLSMLEDGSLNTLTSPIIPLEQHEPLTKITKIVKGKKQSIFVTNKQKAKMISTGMLKEKPSETLFKKPKAIKTPNKVKILSQETIYKSEKEVDSDHLTDKRVSSGKNIAKEETDEENYEEDNIFDDEEPEIGDDADDSDFEIEELLKSKSSKSPKTRKKTPVLEKQVKSTKPKVIEKIEPEVPKLVETEPSKQKDEKLDKKPPVKKDKKTPKPLPDDLALFSTPDIIRRVGGEKTTPEKQFISKPAKISPDSRSKSSNVDQKTKRTSIDIKSNEVRRLSLDNKVHEKRLSMDEKMILSNKPNKVEDQVSVQEFCDTLSNSNESIAAEDQLEPLPSAEDIRAIIQNENTKSFTTSLVIPDASDIAPNEQSFENVGLDLDQSILDNINSDLISEDILYQVAQSLADNIDLQNAIDKSIVDGNLVLDPNLTQNVSDDSLVQNISSQSTLAHDVSSSSTEDTKTSGTQIIRSDGRVVVIPPIERPTTRSRNKKQATTPPTKQKVVQRIFDEEHVSGNELDSSDGEEESEDDPNKLWCICNQPHNNRFMICCDTCEEWYHGKCVNVTKAMGQLMEAQGKEWICVFCKDSSLKRPKAAARRIRKASRTSTDSGGGVKKNNKESIVSSTTSVVEEQNRLNKAPGCVVCGNPSRSSSIYCSDECILKHAQGVEKAVVIDRKNGKLLSGHNAPSSADLDKWLAENPTFEVVRSIDKKVNKNPPIMTQSKLKFVKNKEDNSVSLAAHKKGVNLGVIKHSPKEVPQIKKVQNVSPKRIFTTNVSAIKQSQTKLPTPQKKIKVISTPEVLPDSNTSTPVKPKMVQTKLQLVPVSKEIKDAKEKEKDKVPQPQKTPKARRAEVSGQPRQDNLRDTVRKTFFEQLSSRLKKSEDLKLSEDELKEISNEIESQLYKCFGDTGQKYKNKYRSLIFNIKDAKNQTLWRRICEKSVNPYQLVRLSPDDLASQELALWREREAKHQLDMIKKSELELLSCTRQYVFKTHKGEQVFEEDRPKDEVTDVISGLGTDSSSSLSKISGNDNISSTDGDKNSSKHSRRDKSVGHSRDGSRDRSKSDRDRDSKERKKDKHSSSRDHHHRKRSGSRERSSRHSRKRSKSKDRHRRSSHKSSRHKKDDKTSTTEKLDKKSKEILEQLVDKHIVPPLEDRLWKHVQQDDIVPAATMESDSDHEPSSTVTIPTPPRCSEPDDTFQGKTTSLDTSSVIKERSSTPPPPVQKIVAETIWKGIINMIDVAQISITAKEVSGDCHGLGAELPAILEIVGRISPETVWEYIGKMKSSNSKTISVVQLTATNMEEQMPYLALYSYLCSRNRLGVVKTVSRAVKDFYILPLAGHSPIPEQLLPITGPGFEDIRPALLLGIIVRDKKRRLLDPLPSHNLHPVKKMRIDVLPPIQPATPPSSSRSYTPPPTRDPRVKLPPVAVPTPSPTENPSTDDMDEPYTPEDSDPDTLPEATDTRLNASDITNLLTGSVKSSSFLESGISTQTFEPFSNKFETIPGLDSSPSLPSSSLEIQRKMAELDQRIAAQKAEIDKVSKVLESTKTTDVGNTSLANISLPSNLHQILESIKTIQSKTDNTDIQGDYLGSSISSTPDLTIPLMLPKLSSRSNINISADNTIPLNIPIKSKGKLMDTEKSQSGGLLSSLSEEDLIKKAAEMLGETESTRKHKNSPEPTPFMQSKISRFDLSSQPPIPGLDDS